MSLPLQGQRVVLTRPRDAGDIWRRTFERQGAEVISIPVTEFVPPSSWSEADRAMEELSSYRWAIFTSRQAVVSFFERFRERGKHWPVRMRLAAVGAKTGEELAKQGLNPEVVPEESGGGEALAKAILSRGPIQGTAVLFPRAEEGNEAVINELTRFGAVVSVIPVYRTESNVKSAQAVRNLFRQNVQWVTFASGSAVRAFFSLGGREPALSWFREKGIKIAVLGGTAIEALRKHGGDCTVQAGLPSVESMVEMIVEYERENGK